MSDQGTLHICDFDGRVLATFRTHHGGSPCWMLPKLATWRASAPDAPVALLIAHLLDFPDLGLTITPAGTTVKGYKTHEWRVQPLADLRADGTTPTIRVTATQHMDGLDVTVRMIEGNTMLYSAAAAECEDLARQCDLIAVRQEWDDRTRDEHGYDPAPHRAEAAHFYRLATEPPEDITSVRTELVTLPSCQDAPVVGYRLALPLTIGDLPTPALPLAIDG